ncbi:MAG: NTP/NDP exchange transporter [Verrucomicrobia bacterium]|nr:NTP/NDP exchange transporter [Verrucomicrobiota bacterium]
MKIKLSALRPFFWPVYGKEHRKFLPMLLMAFLICFNYYILRLFKDTIVITAPESGAETLPFLKVWGILPSALLFTFIFTRVSNYFSRPNVFYAMMAFFLTYFLIFTLFLYPNRDALHPNELADSLQSVLPQGFKGMIAMLRNWTYTTFYIMAEMWSTMMMTILFWGFANDVTPLKDARRFYGLFSVGTNFSGIIAGLVIQAFSNNVFNPYLPFGNNAWDQSVTFLNMLVIGVGLLSTVLYWWMNKSGLGYTTETLKAHHEAPTKMGIRKNFAFLARSRYLTLIAILVVTYNIVIALCEIVWKNEIKLLHPDASSFNSYTGGVTVWLSVLATSISLFLSGNAMRIFSWTTSALIAPIMTLITGILFFACLLLPPDSLAGICIYFGMTPLALAVFFGSLQNCLLRGTKYSLVDATKELAFIPLSQESRSKGKAAIDGVGSRLGKSGGSIFQQGLLIAFGSIAASIPAVAAILLVSLGGWMLAVKRLGRQFNQLTAEHQVLTVPEEPALQPNRA